MTLEDSYDSFFQVHRSISIRIILYNFSLFHIIMFYFPYHILSFMFFLLDLDTYRIYHGIPIIFSAQDFITPESLCIYFTGSPVIIDFNLIVFLIGSIIYRFATHHSNSFYSPLSPRTYPVAGRSQVAISFRIPFNLSNSTPLLSLVHLGVL